MTNIVQFKSQTKGKKHRRMLAQVKTLAIGVAATNFSNLGWKHTPIAGGYNGQVIVDIGGRALWCDQSVKDVHIHDEHAHKPEDCEVDKLNLRQLTLARARLREWLAANAPQKRALP